MAPPCRSHCSYPLIESSPKKKPLRPRHEANERRSIAKRPHRGHAVQGADQRAERPADLRRVEGCEEPAQETRGSIIQFLHVGWSPARRRVGHQTDGQETTKRQAGHRPSSSTSQLAHLRAADLQPHQAGLARSARGPAAGSKVELLQPPARRQRSDQNHTAAGETRATP